MNLMAKFEEYCQQAENQTKNGGRADVARVYADLAMACAIMASEPASKIEITGGLVVDS